MLDDRDQSRLLLVINDGSPINPNAQHSLMSALVSWCTTFFELAAKISDVSCSTVYISCSLGEIFSQMSGPLLITRHGVCRDKRKGVGGRGYARAQDVEVR